MSIDKVRKLTESRGCCGFMTIAAMAFAALMFIIPSTCGRSPGPPQGSQDNGPKSHIVAKIGDYAVTAESISTQVDNMRASQPQQGPLEPLAEAQFINEALKSQVTSGTTYQLAEAKGLKFSDDDILKGIESELDSELMMARFQLMQSGRLKPTATEADFNAAFTTATGSDPKSWREQQLDQIKTKLKDPSLRPSLAAGAARLALLQLAASSIHPTDDDVKHQNDLYTFKRILIHPVAGASKKPEEIAATALKEIEGGMGFESAINRYSNESPSPGKPLSDATLPMSVISMVADPAKKDLIKLKPGQVSGVLSVDDGAAIYKLISIKPNPPANFEKNKDNLTKSYTQQLAQQIVNTEIADAVDSASIDWVSKGYKALYDIEKAATVSGAEGLKKLQDIEKSAEAAGGGDDERVSHLATYVASTLIWYRETPEQQSASRKDREEILNALLMDTESISIRLELADLYAADKDGKNAAAQLLNAATYNSDPTAVGQSNYESITAKLAKYKAGGLISSSDEKTIQDELDRWKSDFIEAQKEREQQAQEQAEDRKRAELEKKQAEESIKKTSGSKDATPKKPG